MLGQEYGAEGGRELQQRRNKEGKETSKKKHTYRSCEIWWKSIMLKINLHSEVKVRQ